MRNAPMSSAADSRVLAAARIAGARSRVSRVRLRVILGTLSVFAFAWAVVFVQLIAGRDPVLGAQAATTTATTTDASSSSPPAQRTGRRTRLVAVPTGNGYQVVRVPVKGSASSSSSSSSASSPSSAPTPAPAPLTTSAS